MASYLTVAQLNNPPQDAVQPLNDRIFSLFGAPADPKAFKPRFDAKGVFLQSTQELLFPRGATNMGDTLVATLFLSDDWYTKVMAPRRRPPPEAPMTYSTNTLILEPALPTDVPEEGRARLLSWSIESSTGTVKRKGVALEFPHEFLYDDEGYRFALRIRDHAVDVMSEGDKFGVIRAYLLADDEAHTHLLRELQKDYDQLGAEAVARYFDRTRKLYGALQRDDKAHITIDHEANERLRLTQGRASAYIVPYEVAAYLTTANNLMTTLKEGGEKALDRLYNGPNGFTTWGTSAVYVARGFMVARNTKVDLLRRRRAVGEYYVARQHLDPASPDYNTDWRDIQIMDDDRDDYSTLKFRSVLENSGRWGRDKRLVSLKSPLMSDYSQNPETANDPDMFHFTDRNGLTQVCRTLGEVETRYTDTNFFLVQAKQALRAAGSSVQAATAVIETLRAACRRINSYAYDAAMDEYLRLTSIQNQAGREGQLRDPNTAGTPNVDSTLRDWIPNEHGFLDTPSIDGALAEETLTVIPFDPKADGDAKAKADAALARLQGPLAASEGRLSAAPIPGNPNEMRVSASSRFPAGSLRVRIDGNYVTISYVPVARLSNRYPLPPFASSAAGMETIAAMVKTSVDRENFVKRFGIFSYDECTTVARAYETFAQIIVGMRAGVPLSPLISEDYASSYFHRVNHVTTAFENLISRGGVPLFLRKRVVAKNFALSEATSAGAKGGVRVPLSRRKEEASEFLSISREAERMVQDTFTGRLSSIEDLGRRYPAELGKLGVDAGADFAQVEAITAELETAPKKSDAGALPADAIFLDPLQPGAKTPEWTEAKKLHASLPVLARAAISRDGAGLAEIDVGGGRKIFGYSRAAHTKDDPAGNVYASIAALLFNYRPQYTLETANTEAKTNEMYAQEGARLAVLSLLTLIRLDAPSKSSTLTQHANEIAKRANDVLAAITTAIGVVPASGRATPTVKAQELIDAIADADQTKMNAAFGSKYASVANSINAAFKMAADVAARLKALNVTAAERAAAISVPSDDPRDYMRTPLMAHRAQWTSYFAYSSAENRPVPNALLGDPENVERAASGFTVQSIAEAIATGRGQVHSRLGAHETARLSSLMNNAALNVRFLRDANLLPRLESVEEETRRLNMEQSRRDESMALRAPRAVETIDSGMASYTRDDEMRDVSTVYQTQDSAGAPRSLALMRNDLDEIYMSPPMKDRLNDLERVRESRKAEQVFAEVLLVASTDWTTYDAFLESHIPIDIEPVCVRPHIVQWTQTVLRVEPGEDTAFTPTHKPLTEFGNDPIRGSYFMQMTHYSATIIKNPRNIIKLPDVLINGYEGGFSTVFYDRESYKALDLQLTRMPASLISLLEPGKMYAQGTKLSPVVPLSGSYPWGAMPMRNGRTGSLQRLVNTRWNNAYWGFYQRSNARGPLSDLERSAAKDPLSERNSLFVFAGQSLHYHPKKAEFAYKTSSWSILADEQHYGPGMVAVWKDCTTRYRKQEKHYSAMK